MTETQVRRYTKWMITFGIILITLGLFSLLLAISEGQYMLFFIVPLLILLPIEIIKRLRRIHSLSYDDEALYFSSGSGNEMHKVAFDNIRSIVIGRFDGWCKINLIEPVADGKKIFFKPSVWFPLDFRRSGEKIYAMRQRIDAYIHSKIDESASSIPVHRVPTVT